MACLLCRGTNAGAGAFACAPRRLGDAHGSLSRYCHKMCHWRADVWPGLPRHVSGRFSSAAPAPQRNHALKIGKASPEEWHSFPETFRTGEGMPSLSFFQYCAMCQKKGGDMSTSPPEMPSRTPHPGDAATFFADIRTYSCLHRPSGECNAPECRSQQ